jgi:hypothetical protein
MLPPATMPSTSPNGDGGKKKRGGRWGVRRTNGEQRGRAVPVPMPARTEPCRLRHALRLVDAGELLQDLPDEGLHGRDALQQYAVFLFDMAVWIAQMGHSRCGAVRWGGVGLGWVECDAVC